MKRYKFEVHLHKRAGMIAEFILMRSSNPGCGITLWIGVAGIELTLQLFRR